MKKSVSFQKQRCAPLVLLGTLLGTVTIAYSGPPGYTVGTLETEYTNSGSVSAIDTAGNDSLINENIGVYSDHALTGFTNTNTGRIDSRATVGNALAGFAEVSDISGLRIDGSVNNVLNAGEIRTTASGGDAIGNGSWVYGGEISGAYFADDVETFTNSGTIAASVVIGSAIGSGSGVEADDVHGIFFDYGVETFTSNGTITASAVAGNAGGNDSRVYVEDVFGVFIEDEVETFTNSGTIAASAVAGSAVGDDSWVHEDDVYGVNFYYDVETFTNSGTIAASAVAGSAVGDDSGVYVDDVLGVHFYYDVETFTNSGTITASAVADRAVGDDSRVYVEDVFGVYIDDDAETFMNSGTIAASAVAGSAAGDDSGVYVDDVFGAYFEEDLETFTNSGTLAASAVVGSAIGDDSHVWTSYVHGANFNYDVGSFMNSGTLAASAVAGSAAGDDSSVHVDGIFGAHFSYDVESFFNSGSISAAAGVGDALGAGSGSGSMGIVGVFIDDNVETFTNSGTIAASAVAGSAAGDDSGVYVDDVFGAYFEEDVETFTNSGAITASAVAGSAIGDDSHVWTSYVHGVYFEDAVETFINSGTISAAATVGDLQGADAWASIERVYGVYFDESVDTFTNTGTIATAVTAGADAGIDEVAGIGIYGGSDTVLVNSGNVFLTVDAPYAAAATGAGLWLEDTTATISNPGRIYVSSNLPGAELRTLRAINSDLTLNDEFSIVFGTPGISSAPILLENSSLNLNETTLVADAGRDLLLHTPYAVVEADGGSTVSGTYSQLARGFANPDITVNWVDPNERGADAAVEFGFSPQGNISAVSINAASFWLSDITNKISSLLHNPGGLYTPHYASTTAEQAADGHGLYALPYFTRLSESGLGADVNSYGLLFGYRHVFTDAWSGSVFTGVGRNDLDYTGRYAGASEDQDMWTVGGQLLYEQPFWFVELLAHYDNIRHDYRGRTGANFEILEKDSYRSHAFVAQVTPGLKFDLTESITLSPYVGLRWIYWDSPDHTTDTLPNWSKKYDSFDEHWFKGVAGVDVNAKVKVKEDAVVRMHAGARVEKPLNNDDITLAQTLQGIRAIKSEETVGTSLLGNVGLMYEKGNFTAGVDLTGEYNDDYKAVSGFLRIGMKF